MIAAIADPLPETTLDGLRLACDFSCCQKMRNALVSAGLVGHDGPMRTIRTEFPAMTADAWDDRPSAHAAAVPRRSETSR